MWWNCDDSFGNPMSSNICASTVRSANICGAARQRGRLEIASGSPVIQCSKQRLIDPIAKKAMQKLSHSETYLAWLLSPLNIQILWLMARDHLPKLRYKIWKADKWHVPAGARFDLITAHHSTALSLSFHLGVNLGKTDRWGRAVTTCIYNASIETMAGVEHDGR